MCMTQGNDLHLVTRGIPLAQLRQQGIWSRHEEIADKRGERTRDSELKKTRMAISGLRAKVYIQLLAGFKAQLES